MAQENISERIIKDIGGQLGLLEGDVAPAKRLVADLGADEVDLIIIVVGVEDEFGIEIADAAIDRFATVGDIIDYVTAALTSEDADAAA